MWELIEGNKSCVSKHSDCSGREQEPPCPAQALHLKVTSKELQNAQLALPRNAAHPPATPSMQARWRSPIWVLLCTVLWRDTKSAKAKHQPFVSSSPPGVRPEAYACLAQIREDGGIRPSLIPLCERVWVSSILCQQCLKLLPCLLYRSPRCGQPLKVVQAQTTQKLANDGASCMGQEGERPLPARSTPNRAKASSWGMYRGLGLFV